MTELDEENLFNEAILIVVVPGANPAHTWNATRRGCLIDVYLSIFVLHAVSLEV